MANKNEKHIIVDNELHAEFKELADHEGMTMKGLLKNLIKERKKKNK